MGNRLFDYKACFFTFWREFTKMLKRKVLAHAKNEPHAAHEYKDAWEADVLTVGKKMFAMIGAYKDGRPIVTLKSDPEKALALREAYEGIVIPGYYSNKNHWNSIFLDAEFEETLLFGLIDDSYTLVFDGLTRKEREGL